MMLFFNSNISWRSEYVGRRYGQTDDRICQYALRARVPVHCSSYSRRKTISLSMDIQLEVKDVHPIDL